MPKKEVEICVGTPCHLMGAEELLNMVKDLPARYENNFKFKSSHCINDKCDMAPVVKIDGKVYGEQNPEKLRELLDNYLRDNI